MNDALALEELEVPPRYAAASAVAVESGTAALADVITELAPSAQTAEPETTHILLPSERLLSYCVFVPPALIPIQIPDQSRCPFS